MNKLIVGIIIFVVVLLIYVTLLSKYVSLSSIQHMISNWFNLSGAKYP